MRAMVIFERCRNAERELERIRQRIRQRRDAIESITAHADDIGGGRGSGGDRMGEFAAAIDELERALRLREDARREELSAVIAMLDGLPSAESEVLYRLYARGMSVAAVAKKLHYTEGYVRKLRGRGWALIEEIPPERVDGLLSDAYRARSTEEAR